MEEWMIGINNRSFIYISCVVLSLGLLVLQFVLSESIKKITHCVWSWSKGKHRLVSFSRPVLKMVNKVVKVSVFHGQLLPFHGPRHGGKAECRNGPEWFPSLFVCHLAEDDVFTEAVITSPFRWEHFRNAITQIMNLCSKRKQPINH